MPASTERRQKQLEQRRLSTLITEKPKNGMGWAFLWDKEEEHHHRDLTVPERSQKGFPLGPVLI